MRVRVELDITKPLIRWKKFNFGLSKSVWLYFTYERLPDLYFCCGYLGHGLKECKQWPSMKEKNREGRTALWELVEIITCRQ